MDYSEMPLEQKLVEVAKRIDKGEKVYKACDAVGIPLAKWYASQKKCIHCIKMEAENREKKKAKSAVIAYIREML
jgi:cytochrome c2